MRLKNILEIKRTFLLYLHHEVMDVNEIFEEQQIAT